MLENFTKKGIPENIAKAMADMGWEKPTPIQEESVAYGIEGKDMFAQAQTGTGKTGAFGTIILGRVPSGQKIPSAIVLVPTRELANQVAGEIDNLAKYTGHETVAVYGGASIETQINKLGQGADIIAGTPGRVKDLIERRELNLSEIQILVLDEADRMLDMGFIEDIEDIMKSMPRGKQMLLFSATMPEDIKRLASDYMEKPKEITVSKDELVLDLTKQYYIAVGRRNKTWALSRILDIDKPKAIIFCQTKRMVDMLQDRLTKLRYKVEAIHGDFHQSKREKVIQDLREGKTEILIATDVAARGLDVDDIDYVINYDMPDDVDTYIHRIGRTGRAGKEGTAVSFVTSSEEYLVKEFEIRTGMEIEKREVPEEEGMKDRVRKVIDYDQLSDHFGMVRFSVNLGKKDGYTRISLVDFVIRNARIRDIAVGKVELGDDYSVIEVHRDFGNRMTMDLPKSKHKGKYIEVDVIDPDDENGSE